MRAFKDYNETQSYTEIPKLPSGAYKVKIIRAEEQNGKNNSCALCLLFDISEGEYSGYFMKRFAAEKKSYPDTAKYKGVLRLWYPNGGEYNESSKRRMKTALERIKESNDLNIDFTKEWDGAKLKNCEIGMLFRDEEYDYNGHQGMAAQPYGVVTLADLKDGNFKLPSPKYLNGKSTGAPTETDEFDVSDDDLPF